VNAKNGFVVAMSRRPPSRHTVRPAGGNPITTENPMSAVLKPRTAAAPVDPAAIKQRQQATWASGDFAVIGTTLQIVGESLAEAVDLRAGERVLDVAAGNGNATLAAARRFADVTSTDYVPALLDKGRQRAEAEGLQVRFLPADAEALPFADGSFDVVLSTFGAMFTPDHERPAREMLRVLRDGGRIGLANWTPDGFIGRLFKVIGAYVPPPAGLRSPALWGTEPHIVELFGSQSAQIRCERKYFNFRYRSAAHWVQVFRDYYGPTLKAFAALDAAGQKALEREITALLDSLNTAGVASLVVPAEYLEVVITKGAAAATRR
jgi:ubiquinone/menaquinone biosynthesis C-methylase UbiE